MPQKRKVTKKEKAPKSAARKKAASRPRRASKKAPSGEAAQIHQNIHPVEPTPELKPR